MVYRLQATIHGKVQGIFFRKFTVKNAKKLGLTGWVKNMPDGTVKVKAEGEKSDLEELVKHLHTGPQLAKVAKVETKFSESDRKKYDHFRVAY